MKLCQELQSAYCLKAGAHRLCHLYEADTIALLQIAAPSLRVWFTCI